MTIFKALHPVCPVLDMSVHLHFWDKLGFLPAFGDCQPYETADYVGIARDGLELHLQTFTREQLKETQTMALRIEMTGKKALEALHDDWKERIKISAPLSAKPWGTVEFGFYDPANTPFFFYVDRS